MPIFLPCTVPSHVLLSEATSQNPPFDLKKNKTKGGCFFLFLALVGVYNTSGRIKPLLNLT